MIDRENLVLHDVDSFWVGLGLRIRCLDAGKTIEENSVGIKIWEN